MVTEVEVSRRAAGSRQQQEQVIRELLDLQYLASSRQSRLLQVCVIDHASPTVRDGQGSPHIHLQFLFSDRARTPWMYVEANVETLQEVVPMWAGALRPRINLRLHVHEEAVANGGPASKQVIAILPRLVLNQRSALRLANEGHDVCPMCLEAFAAGEEIVCMPCSGNHLTHASCLNRWLATASTCPSCRFMLPSSKKAASAESELRKMCAPACAELERIRRDEPPPCPPCDDDEVVERMLPQDRMADVASVEVAASSPTRRIDEEHEALGDEGAEERGHPRRRFGAARRASSRLFQAAVRRSSSSIAPDTPRASPVHHLLGVGRCLFNRA
eukprot:CAMPEP_0115857612 /NCGR_PEP_ID=MMETSP0287-20121206/15664_1 /TAXON_ID=412157 /ORGANISM="Chrysochromulina rotalis, Strain UIO044" /LENGTH=330 /DNA_ID=CAMNT_0003311835 /DNA_START=19 /DNA_END=1011 /DNA_ORIENTATION=-